MTFNTARVAYGCLQCGGLAFSCDRSAYAACGVMFDKILVPLDGSDMAESALAPAFSLASHCGRQVVLLRVTLPQTVLSPAGAPPPASSVMTSAHKDEQAEAAAYLARVKERWAGADIPIETHVLAGAPAELIVKVAQQQRVDLIVMSTHGRTGFSRLIYGSVAEAVLRGARLPLLLIPIGP